ncbi:hypothetical protein LCGC14_1301520 [marine sediment metagenome]|uniref:Uncharacterized protein n=1 Tax=marine sediment metagenome TaxID=412755 RepID=A0A0F9KPU3_9ZZZZ
MGRYIKDFKKIVWGFAEIEADTLKEAEEKFDDGDYSEFDNKDDYEWECIKNG